MRSAVRVRTGLPFLRWLLYFTSCKAKPPANSMWVPRTILTAGFPNTPGATHLRLAVVAFGSAAPRIGNQALEVVAADSRPHFCASWLERADRVGQVCGSSPHGPTIPPMGVAVATSSLLFQRFLVVLDC